MYDAVVVGGGPAGLTAATWLARYRRQVLLVDAGEHRNRWVEQSHGYFAHDPAPPRDLLAAARRSLGGYRHASIHDGCVTDVHRDGGEFVLTIDESPVRALRVVLATGVVDAFPVVEGFREHYGASVFHCPTCDGLEAEGREVVVLGWSEHVAGFALNVLDWAAAVTIVTDGREFPGDTALRRVLRGHGVRVVEDEAVRFDGARGDLRAVELREAGRVPCQLAFFSVANQPRTQLAVSLGCERTEEGCLAVDDSCATTVPGVYAAGDVTPGIQLVQVAAAKGAVAGISAALSLRGEPGSPASPEPGPDVESVLADVQPSGSS